MHVFDLLLSLLPLLQATAVQPTPVACPKPAIELFHMLCVFCASQCGSVDLQTCNAAGIVDDGMTSARHHSL